MSSILDQIHDFVPSKSVDSQKVLYKGEVTAFKAEAFQLVVINLQLLIVMKVLQHTVMIPKAWNCSSF